ncbi:hypothetical protein [Psychroserpens luteolus]|uniref:hypothetical protein n=1 Tax=Psychroserpens luteolus TaxID=2855840 RepID=UPI001E2D4E01|nr:hypothetical protein [Psychroserpens luteolus]MCD2259604.1 hypothetical protein [Psychroserpens luteolus]
MKRFLYFLLIFLGIGAIYGGSLLVVSPSGEALGLPLSLLETSPFSNFLIPGIILLLLLGIAPLLLVIALVKKPSSRFAQWCNCFKDMHWSWSFTIYLAFALMIWIQVQEVLINSVYWLHTLYMLWAMLILFVAIHPTIRHNYNDMFKF